MSHTVILATVLSRVPFFCRRCPQGFLTDTLEPNEASLAVEEEYPCKVLPLSKLEMNETGIENGDIDHIFARFYVSANQEWRGRHGGSKIYATVFVARVLSVSERVSTKHNSATEQLDSSHHAYDCWTNWMCVD